MAAAPHFTSPSTPVRPAATILRFPHPHALTPVAPDPREGWAPIASVAFIQEIAAAWALVVGLAIVGFVLS
jgi:hypothetical protein